MTTVYIPPAPPTPRSRTRTLASVLAVLALAIAPLVAAPAAFADEVLATSVVAPVTSSLTGDLRVGSTVTVESGAWDPVSATLTYEWWQSASAYVAPVGGVDQNPGAAVISGATTESLALTPELNGRFVWGVVTGSADGLTPATIVVGGATPVAAGILADAPTPTLTGTVRVENPVTAEPGAWPAGTAFAYRWLIVDSKGVVTVSKTTTQSYAPTASTLGKKLSVEVTGTTPGYAPAKRTSASVTIAPGVFTAAPVPVITGTKQVGSTLTATAGTWTPTAALSYQWKRSGASIAGATASTYKLTTSDAGKTMTVTVTAKRTSYSTAARTSVATTAVLRTFAGVTSPKIVGTARAGVVLSISMPAWSPTPTLTYQWYRSGVAITGATASTFKLSSKDVGSTVTVKVTGKRSGYATRIATSAATAKVVAPNSILRDGLFAVGTQIAPGTYVATGGNSCDFERRSNANVGEQTGYLGGNYNAGANVGGPKVITIKSTDKYFFTQSCGTWKLPVTNLKNAVKDGTWIVGKDITPGTWQVFGPFDSDGCWVAYHKSFTGDPEVDLQYSWLEESVGAAYYITPDVKGFSTDGCGTWKRVGGLP